MCKENTAFCRDSFEGCSEQSPSSQLIKNHVFWANCDYGYRFEKLYHLQGLQRYLRGKRFVLSI